MDQLDQFFESLYQKKADGELDIALEQCKQSKLSFVRGYVAYGLLKGWDCNEMILRFNKEFLDGQYDEKELTSEVEFYTKSIQSIPVIRERIDEFRAREQRQK